MKNITAELVDHEKAFSEINYNDIKDKPWSELTTEEMLVAQINDTTPLMTTAYRGGEMLARCMNVSSTLAFNVIGMLRGIRDEHGNEPDRVEVRFATPEEIEEWENDTGNEDGEEGEVQE